MDQKNLYLDLNHAFNALFYRLSAVNDTCYNSSPDGRWTTGQLADHLFLCARGLLLLVNGPAELRDEPSASKIPRIRSYMLDFSRSYPSPASMIPGSGPFDRIKQTDELNQLQLGWLEAARLLDPAATCLLFPIPAVGFVTRQEAGHFIVYHFQRHLRHMKNVE